MCGRFVLKSTPETLIRIFGLDACAALEPRYNIPPGTDIAVIRQSPEGRRVLHKLRWGLVPHWARDPAHIPNIGSRLNNARGETVAEKPAFRDAFRRRRCLIPADGFYEWQARDGHKQAFYVSLPQPFAMAGLWEAWKAPDGEILRTCCIITTGPNQLMQGIHPRMPVIIPPGDWQRWLSGPASGLTELLHPYPDASMRAWPVDRRVSKTSNDDAGLLEPVVLDGEAAP